MSDEDFNEELISKKRRIFTIDEKFEVVNFMKTHSIHEAKHNERVINEFLDEQFRSTLYSSQTKQMKRKQFSKRAVVGLTSLCFDITYASVFLRLFVKSHQLNTCGITNAFDGSEDGEIHCFKENGPVPNGMIRLQQAREMAEFDILAEGIAGLFEEVDVEQDEENGFISDGSVEL
uniref:Uncharacterized protein n=1 Tax=Globodera rostochiensis TaxID=31243 RepID=A0A914HRD9_GLORO